MLWRAGMLLGACLAAGCGILGSGSPGPYEGDIPEGTMMWVRLEKPLSSEYSFLGEQIRGRTASEVQSESGAVLIPRGTLVLGQVRERIGGKIWIPLEIIIMDGVKQRIRARFLGAEDGFRGRLHAGDELMVRLDRPMWSLLAVRMKAVERGR